MGATCAQKIFSHHTIDTPVPGVQVLRLDLVLCHEITTPIAISDLMDRDKDTVFDPARIKAVIDHVTPSKDSKSAMQAKVLRDWARRHAITDFFDVGENGVCHALFPEKRLVRPGMAIIMGDSHTCTYGAFGAFGAGVGTTDLEVGILKGVCAFREPRTIRITCHGTLPDHVYAKDVILDIIRRLTVNGATDHVIEFGGETITAMSMDERMTLCNMAVEAGATTGLCMPDETTLTYLWPSIAAEYDNDKDTARAAFAAWCSDDDAEYSDTITVDVSCLEPLTTMEYKPDNVVTLGSCKDVTIDQVYIGSCTNGRMSDLREAARITRGHHLAGGVRGIVSPATTQTYRDALAEGIIDTFLDAGYCVINPTCGACLGMSNGVLAPGEVCAATTNRNFYGRMGKGGMVHLMSPASAAASGITGRLTDPRDID